MTASQDNVAVRLSECKERQQRLRNLLGTSIMTLAALLVLMIAPITSDRIVKEQQRTLHAEFWRSIVFNSESGVLVVDAETRAIVDINKGAETLLGWSAEEVKGYRIDFLLPERYRDRHEELLADPSLRTTLLSKVVRFQGYINTKRGVQAHVAGRVQGFTNHRYYFVIHLDSTESIVDVAAPEQPPPASDIPVQDNFGERIDVDQWKSSFLHR